MSKEINHKEPSSIPPLGGWGGYIKDVYRGVKSLLVGMKRTMYYFTHHKEEA